MAIDERFGDDLLLSEVEREEDMLLQASDAIDSKSSQILAAVAVLAAQAALLFAIPGSSKAVLGVQAIVAIPLFLALFFAHRALRIRIYNTSDFSDTWRAESISQANGDEQIARDLIVWSLLIAARGRVEVASAQNTLKETDLARARIALSWAIVTNVAVILLATILRFH